MHLLYSLLLLFPSLLLGGQSIQPDLKGQTIVVERKDNEVGVRTVIAVDRDDAVRLIDFSARTDPPVISANLGARVLRSGRVELAKVLPHDKVATAARRVTLRNGDVIHVVIVWGLSSFELSHQAFCSLYIYRESRSGVEEIFSEELGAYMDQFIVEDLNHDGNVEILVATGENAVRLMYIWQIHPNGRITELQKIEGYEVNTEADRFMGLDSGILVTNKSKRPGCYDTTEYLWSPKRKKFIRSSR